MESVASRGLFSGFLSRGDDTERIQKCKEDSQRYLRMLEVSSQIILKRRPTRLDMFDSQLQSHITTRQAVSHMQEQTNAIVAAVNAQPSLDTSTKHSSSPTNPPVHSTPFRNIESKTEEIINSIDGNHVVNNSTTNVSSTNSRKAINISITDSNNSGRRANVSTGSRRDPSMPARGRR